MPLVHQKFFYLFLCVSDENISSMSKCLAMFTIENNRSNVCIDFIKNKKSNNSLVLFDDEPRFAESLNAGKGKASIDEDDCISGKACLTVSGFQRYSGQLPGWDFNVRKNPKSKDEFLSLIHI